MGFHTELLFKPPFNQWEIQQIEQQTQERNEENNDIIAQVDLLTEQLNAEKAEKEKIMAELERY